MNNNNKWLQGAICYIRVNSGMVYSSQVVEYLISEYRDVKKLKEDKLISELNKYLEDHNCMPLSIDIYQSATAMRRY